MKQISILKRKAKKEVDNLAKKKMTVVNTNINGLVDRLLVIMKKHIGRENKVSRDNLFYKVYGIKRSDVSELQAWLMAELLRKAQHRCRQSTKCFIVNAMEHTIYYFWVAKDRTDYFVYKGIIDRNIVAMKTMVNKCEKAINEEWHAEDWTRKKQELKIEAE